MVSTLVLRYFGSPHLGNRIKTNRVIFETVDSHICSILMLQKKVWDYFLHYIYVLAFEKIVSHVIFY